MRRLDCALVAAGISLLASGPALADDTVRVLAPTWPGYAPVFVAIDKGYFKELGLDVDMKFEDDRSNVLAAMTRGDIEVDMRTVGEHQGRPRDASTPGVIIG
ncbi:MAG TPA: ABC transporter substrate-binding protein, partial [Hansschlegelia sp.]